MPAIPVEGMAWREVAATSGLVRDVCAPTPVASAPLAAPSVVRGASEVLAGGTAVRLR